MGIQKVHASGPFVLKDFYELELHLQLGKYFDLEHLLFLLELCDPPMGPFSSSSTSSYIPIWTTISRFTWNLYGSSPFEFGSSPPSVLRVLYGSTLHFSFPLPLRLQVPHICYCSLNGIFSKIPLGVTTPWLGPMAPWVVFFYTC